MKLKKFTIAVSLITLLAGVTIPAHAVDFPDEQFVISSPPGNIPSFGVVIEDSQKLKNTFSTLQAFTSDGNQIGSSKVLSENNCFEYGTAECGQDKIMNFMANLASIFLNLSFHLGQLVNLF